MRTSAAADRRKARDATRSIVGVNYPDTLVGLYDEELEHIRKNYDLVKALDADLLREFDVSPERIMGCLKARLTGLRNTYWQELFSHMKSVTNPLTSKERRTILETLNRQGHVDFTVSNIHAVLLWVLKNANSCLNAQLLETFDPLVSKANVRNYQSNHCVFFFDRWRYAQEKPTHIIALEYRLVLAHMGGVRKGYEWERGLAKTAAEFLGDLLTVAHGLGFFGDTADSRLTRSGRKDWESGQLQGFTCTSNGVEEVLFKVRGFLNGNLHLRIHKDFALALNVEVGRLRGWLKSGQEATDEIGDQNAAKYFGRNVQLNSESLLMLAA